MLKDYTNMNNDALLHYYNKDYQSLAKCDLKQSINSDGDTIVHLMARDLNKPAIEFMLRYNPAQAHDLINSKNKKMQTPINKAIEVNGHNIKTSQFVDFLNNIPKDKKIQNMNNMVINNIKNLRNQTKEFGNQNYNPNPNLAGQISDNNISFIRKLTDHYATQHGGYSGKRIIQKYHSNLDALTESGDNDTFAVWDKKQSANNRFVGGRRQSKYNNNNNRLSEDSSDINTDDFKNLYDEDKDEQMNSDSTDNIYPDEISSLERARDTVADDMYRSFIQKIMDILDVDEEKARFYRTALKINLENTNPELKKRVNDSIKIKELDAIISNKEKLKSTLDKIDLDKIEKFMTERKEEGEKRRQERETDEKKVNRGTDKINRGADNKIDNVDKKKVADKTQKSDKPVATKTRAKKTTNVAEDGYLLSDSEMLFSPN